MKINVKVAPEPFGGRYQWIYRIEVKDAHCKVCGVNFKSWWQSSPDHKRRKEVGICSTCDFWVEKLSVKDQPNVARINGKHYILGNELEAVLDPSESFTELFKRLESTHPRKQGMGMSGALWAIRFSDGRVVFTNDLWHQGDIPEEFQVMLPNNAEFMSRS